MTSTRLAWSPSHGARVRAARKALGLTQAELSAHMGWADRQTLSAVEHGMRRVDADELVRLSERLDREVTFFVDPFEVTGETRWVTWGSMGNLGEPTPWHDTVGRWLGLWRALRPQAEDVTLALGLRADPRFSAVQLGEQALALGSTWRRQAGETCPLHTWVTQRLAVPVWQVAARSDQPEGLWGRLPELDVLIVAPTAQRSLDVLVAEGLFHVLTDSLWQQVRRQATAQARLKAAFVEGLLQGWGSVHPASPLWWGKGPLAPDLAAAGHHALSRGAVSARKFARTLGLTLDETKQWFQAHGLSSPFDL